jgi:predicted ATPase
MILEQLSLANFRGFEQIDLKFDPRVTVIAGVNGVGKSGILRVLTILFAHALPEFTPARTMRNPPSIADEDIAHGRSSLTLSMVFHHAGLSMEEIGTRARVNDAQMALLDEKLRLIRQQIRYAGKNDRKKLRVLNREEETLLAAQTQPDDEYDLLLAVMGDKSRDSVLRQLRESGEAPLAIVFTPNRQLSERPRTLASPAPFEPESAYLDALSERSLRLGDFMAWFNSMEKLPGKGQKRRRRVVTRLKEVVSTFIPEFLDLRIEQEPQLRFVVDKESTDKHGKKIRTPLSFHQLSDGERGLLAILFDITRRLVIANPDADDPVSEGSAVVLIDEIELHLHPVWQRQVLRRFTETFQGCQFIVTSHSPLVLGEVPGKSIRFLYREEGRVKQWTPDFALGLDANRVLEDLMFVKSRDSEVADRITEMFREIDADNFPSARLKMAALEKTLGQNDPELQRARSLIAFLEGDV